MNFRKHAFLTTLAVLIFAPLAIADDNVDKPNWKYFARDGDKVIFLLDWCRRNKKIENSNCISTKGYRSLNQSEPTIDGDDKVIVKIVGFNFLQYDISLDTSSKKLEIYETLLNIISPLETITNPFNKMQRETIQVNYRQGSNTSTKSNNFQTFEWRLYKASSALAKTVSSLNGAISINPKQPGGQTFESYEKELQVYVEDLDKSHSDVEKEIDSVFNNSSTIQMPEYYSKFVAKQKDYAAFKEAYANFEKLLEYVKNGKELEIKGTSDDPIELADIVTVVVTPSPNEGHITPQDQSAMLETEKLEYLVENSNFVFSVGATLASFQDNKFEVVQALGGRDLFAQVRDSEGVGNLSGFLSYPFDRRWHGTVGTDIEDPLDNLYLGVSYKFNKSWLFTVGGAWGRVAEGEDAVTDSADTIDSEDVSLFKLDDSDDSSRTLFEAIDEKREWAAFMSLSYIF